MYFLLPVRVRAENGDSHYKIHHDGDEDHAEAQQNGSVLPRSQRCHCLPPVQDVIFTNPVVDGSARQVTEKVSCFQCLALKLMLD